MTTTGGGPALHGAGAATPAGDGGPGVSVRRAPRLRTVLDLARAEASLLARSVLVLAGLLAGGLVIWLFIRPTEPLWWRADWEIGGGQLVLGMAVLVAAQLAAGRARRDTMADLYASFPLGVTLAWYAIASAALILTCAAMRDSRHRYSHGIHRSVVS